MPNVEKIGGKMEFIGICMELIGTPATEGAWGMVWGKTRPGFPAVGNGVNPGLDFTRTRNGGKPGLDYGSIPEWVSKTSLAQSRTGERTPTVPK